MLDADLVIVTAGAEADVPPSVIATLQAAYARGAAAMGLCSGAFAFALGAAGLLDGRRCTTHWRHAAALAERFPAAEVDPNVLYVCDGRVYTSAGTAAGLDRCLHLIRTEHGAGVANAIARRMVVPPQRAGGQAQYIETPVRPRVSDGLAELMDDLLGRLYKPHSVESMAHRLNMSPRTFARRFAEATGTTPHAWLLRQRVLFARRQLESGTTSSAVPGWLPPRTARRSARPASPAEDSSSRRRCARCPQSPRLSTFGRGPRSGPSRRGLVEPAPTRASGSR